MGSLLRPPTLRRAHRLHQDGQLSEDQFRHAQEEAIREAVSLQEKVGLRLVTDGEFRGASYWSRFVDGIDGMEVREALFEFRDDSGERLAFSAPHVAARLSRPGTICGDELTFLGRATTAAPKLTLPAPSTMHFWRGPAGREPSTYADLEELFVDLADIYRREVVESPDDLRRAIDEASPHVPIERLGLSPQCGFASTVAGNPLTEDDQRRKLELVVEVAQEVWGTT